MSADHLEPIAAVTLILSPMLFFWIVFSLPVTTIPFMLLAKTALVSPILLRLPVTEMPFAPLPLFNSPALLPAITFWSPANDDPSAVIVEDVVT